MDPRRQRRRLLVALFATAVSTQSPSPLLLRYVDVLDLGALTLTLFSAAYAVGLVPSLPLAGPLSDRDGRRTVVVGGVLAALVCTVVLIGVDVGGVAFLVVGRIAQGLASGAVFTVGTVWLRELSAGTDATAPARVRRAAAVASAAMAGRAAGAARGARDDDRPPSGAVGPRHPARGPAGVLGLPAPGGPDRLHLRRPLPDGLPAAGGRGRVRGRVRPGRGLGAARAGQRRTGDAAGHAAGPDAGGPAGRGAAGLRRLRRPHRAGAGRR